MLKSLFRSTVKLALRVDESAVGLDQSSQQHQGRRPEADLDAADATKVVIENQHRLHFDNYGASRNLLKVALNNNASGKIVQIFVDEDGPTIYPLPVDVYWDAEKRVVLLENHDNNCSLVVDGPGYAAAVRDGDSEGHVWRVGDGNGHAMRDGNGDGCAVRSGSGDGDAIRDGDGCGDAWRTGEGYGDAVNGGPYGDAWRCGNGRGNASKIETGDDDCEGNAVRAGSGYGHAYRDGSGYGNAVRVGEGDGDAERSGSGEGNAVRVGDGAGDARCLGVGVGDAVRDGDGSGYAVNYRCHEAHRLGVGAGRSVTI